MKQIKIAHTDLILSPVGLGTVKAGISWDHEDAFRLFDFYLSKGGNIIDTAHVYSDWEPGEIARSERVVGDWIRSRRHRNDFILITKGGHPHLDTMQVSRLSKEEMTDDLDDSLKKLGTDYIDIYLYHRDDPTRSVEELIETMEEFRCSGKIRYYGCSNWTTQRMLEADAYCREKGYRGFVANQAFYNIGTQYMKPYSDPTMVICDSQMLDYHRNSENLLMPYMGVCKGFFHNLKRRKMDVVTASCYYTPGNIKIANHIFQLCQKKDITITQALLGFFYIQDFPCVPLAGANTLEQLAEFTDTFSIKFSAEEYSFLTMA